jgi:ubiquinone biosynthesis monooxygenase Coq7
MTRIGSTDQILRVNHAGERGAISIYKGQILISRLLHPSCVEPLESILGHEQRHFRTFDSILKSRGLRACHALVLWAVGGWLLGVITALAGQRAIWVCTAAIENTVNQHLAEQVAFIGPRDPEVLAAVQSIRADEEAHEDHALTHGGIGTGLYLVLRSIIVGATSFAIWLSTKL